MEWLTRPLTCAGAVVAEPLDPAHLADADLRSICLRMHVIMGTIEMPRCEGRLIPVALFDAIDTLESMILYGHSSPDGHRSPPRLAEWSSTVQEFGRYYHLAGGGPITVDPVIYREVTSRYCDAQPAEPHVAPTPAT